MAKPSFDSFHVVQDPPTFTEETPTVRWPTPSTGYALIADADRRVTDMMAALIATHDLIPVIAHDDTAAFTALRERGVPRLTIANVALPGAGDFSILCALRKQAPASRAPALVICETLLQRKRAHDLKAALGIGEIATPRLPVETIDRMIESLLDEAHEPPSSAVLEVLLASTAKRFGVSTVVLSFSIRDVQPTTLHHGSAGELLASARMFPLFVQGRYEPLVVTNLLEHPAYSRHPLVKAGVVGSCVCMPLTSSRGMLLGYLTVCDPGYWLGSPALVDALRSEARGLAAMLTGKRTPPATRGPTARPDVMPPVAAATTTTTSAAATGTVNGANVSAATNPATVATVRIPARRKTGSPPAMAPYRANRHVVRRS